MHFSTWQYQSFGNSDATMALLSIQAESSNNNNDNNSDQHNTKISCPSSPCCCDGDDDDDDNNDNEKTNENNNNENETCGSNVWCFSSWKNPIAAIIFIFIMIFIISVGISAFVKKDIINFETKQVSSLVVVVNQSNSSSSSNNTSNNNNNNSTNTSNNNNNKTSHYTTNQVVIIMFSSMWFACLVSSLWSVIMLFVILRYFPRYFIHINFVILIILGTFFCVIASITTSKDSLSSIFIIISLVLTICLVVFFVGVRHKLGFSSILLKSSSEVVVQWTTTIPLFICLGSLILFIVPSFVILLFTPAFFEILSWCSGNESLSFVIASIFLVVVFFGIIQIFCGMIRIVTAFLSYFWFFASRASFVVSSDNNNNNSNNKNNSNNNNSTLLGDSSNNINNNNNNNNNLTTAQFPSPSFAVMFKLAFGAFLRTFTIHLGSLVVGSGITTFVKYFEVVLKTLSSRTRSSAGCVCFLHLLHCLQKYVIRRFSTFVYCEIAFSTASAIASCDARNYQQQQQNQNNNNNNNNNNIKRKNKRCEAKSRLDRSHDWFSAGKIASTWLRKSVFGAIQNDIILDRVFSILTFCFSLIVGGITGVVFCCSNSSSENSSSSSFLFPFCCGAILAWVIFSLVFATLETASDSLMLLFSKYPDTFSRNHSLLYSQLDAELNELLKTCVCNTMLDVDEILASVPLQTKSSQSSSTSSTTTKNRPVLIIPQLTNNSNNNINNSSAGMSRSRRLSSSSIIMKQRRSSSSISEKHPSSLGNGAKLPEQQQRSNKKEQQQEQQCKEKEKDENLAADSSIDIDTTVKQLVAEKQIESRPPNATTTSVVDVSLKQNVTPISISTDSSISV